MVSWCLCSTDCHFAHVQTTEAMRLGHEAAAYVSGQFPPEMELKFEKVAQPFLLLHVNRCALLHLDPPLSPFAPCHALLYTTM